MGGCFIGRMQKCEHVELPGMKKIKNTTLTCAACGHVSAGNYCSNCGQELELKRIVTV